MINVELLPSSIWFSSADIALAMMILDEAFVSWIQTLSNEPYVNGSLLLVSATFLRELTAISDSILLLILSLSSLPLRILTLLLSVLSKPFQFL